MSSECIRVLRAQDDGAHSKACYEPRRERKSRISAIATETRRVRLETITLCNGFRSPALLAKMASTLDAIPRIGDRLRPVRVRTSDS